MSAIFSVQNLQTFLRRKNFRPPSRGGPPGPERPPPPPPPKRGRSPPPERSPKGREGRSPDGAGAFVSSVIILFGLRGRRSKTVASRNCFGGGKFRPYGTGSVLATFPVTSVPGF